MSRQARVVLPGVPHHITHRGNNRQDVFLVPQDRGTYLRFLRDAALENAVVVHAYCLMSNHVHMVVTPEHKMGLSRCIQQAHLKYATYFNGERNCVGHLWQQRFFCCPLDEEHYWQALRYVECNPVRAGMVARAYDYIWSSAKAHVAASGKSRLLDLEKWRADIEPQDWKEILAQEQLESEVRCMRLNTQSGRPLGTEEFVAAAEVALGRRLHAKAVGRPRK